MFEERHILLLEIAPGVCSFEKWYGSVKDASVRAVIFAKITRLADPGFKAVGGGVFELRVFAGPGYRIYFGLKGRKAVILLAGGDKQSQRKDIDDAKKLWKKYKDEGQRFKRKLAVK